MRLTTVVTTIALVAALLSILASCGPLDDTAIIELTAAIAWENASGKFNRALRVTAQGLWRREGEGPE